LNGLMRRVPEGFTAVDLFPGASAPLRVCVLARVEPQAGAGRLVVIRDVLDASVCLGCVVDASGSVDAWLEIWVQRVDTLTGSAGGGRATLTNASLEERWKRTVDGLEATAPDLLIRTGLENEPAAAFGLDLRKGVRRPPMHEASGDFWDICRDEDALAARGLRSYRSSLARYLWVSRLGDDSPFVDACDAEAVRAEVLTGVNRELEPFNLQGGLMMVRRLSPIAFAEYADVVGGRSWSGIRHGVASIDLREGRETIVRSDGIAGDPEPIDPDRLFLGRHGRWGRLVESLHLKVKMLAEAVNAVRSATARTGRPLLNITDESFRVELWEAGVGLPRLWTSRVRLVDPGTAHEMTIGGVRARGFVSPDGIGRGIYRPEVGGEAASGRCDFRIRSIDPDDPAGAVVEATFRSDSRVSGGGGELLELRVPIEGERLLLHGRLRADEALGPGELRFRSEATALDARTGSLLKAAEGVPLKDVSFEVVPLASTPCDLHALGVLGVRSLLVDGQNTLAVALDELVSLARAASVEQERDASLSLEAAFEQVFLSDERWVASIGPQRLVTDGVPAAQAIDMVPPEIWVRLLSVLARMLLGATAEGYCRGVGDTRGLAPHLVFEAPGADLASLLVRTRSLIVVDWRHNREVHAVLRRHREGMADA
jgi:hypothetical protein